MINPMVDLATAPIQNPAGEAAGFIDALGTTRSHRTESSFHRFNMSVGWFGGIIFLTSFCWSLTKLFPPVPARQGPNSEQINLHQLNSKNITIRRGNQ